MPQNAQLWQMRPFMEVSMRPRRFDAKTGCAVGVTLSVIGGMWKPLILFHLFAGKKRFMELSRAIPNATQRILTLQLRELEADGVIVRHAYPQIPPKVEYEISAFGQSLGPDHADRKSTRLNSSHQIISYAVFCLKKKIVTNNR